MVLAETQAFLQRRKEEYMAIEEEIRYILDELLRYDCDFILIYRVGIMGVM